MRGWAWRLTRRRSSRRPARRRAPQYRVTLFLLPQARATLSIAGAAVALVRPRQRPAVQLRLAASGIEVVDPLRQRWLLVAAVLAPCWWSRLWRAGLATAAPGGCGAGARPGACCGQRTWTHFAASCWPSACCPGAHLPRPWVTGSSAWRSSAVRGAWKNWWRRWSASATGRPRRQTCRRYASRPSRGCAVFGRGAARRAEGRALKRVRTASPRRRRPGPGCAAGPGAHRAPGVRRPGRAVAARARCIAPDRWRPADGPC